MQATHEKAEDRRAWAIALVGSAVPEALCSQTVDCNTSGNKFQIELLDAIRSVSGASVFVLSALSIGSFPKSRRIAVPFSAITVRKGISGWLIPFINTLFFKQITIGLANSFFLLVWLWQNRRKRRFLLVYNVYPSNSFPALIATRIMGGTSVAVVADFPHNMSFNFRGLRGALQRFDVWLEAASLPHFDGIIPITRYVTDDFAPKCPALVMEGGVAGDEPDGVSGSGSPSTASPEKVCFFSGTLYEVNGIRLLLDAFQLIPDPNYRLWICGRGPMERLVRSAAAQDKRIVYLGFLPNSEVMKIQQQATLLLNARPTDQLVARYTFPSKLREYMLSGRPTLSTVLPGIPEEYRDFIYILREEDPKALASMIQEICSRPDPELDDFGQRARRFMLTSKTWKQQGKRVCEFLETL